MRATNLAAIHLATCVLYKGTGLLCVQVFPWCLSTAVTGRHFGGWGRSGYSTWSEARSAQKLPLVPAVKLFLRGCVSICRYKHTVPPFCRFFSTSPIDYYDGGTMRLNTEFYSWDTSFGLVHPRLRCSCLQVVFCVNLGTFFKCFLQLGWRLMGVRSTLAECSPYAQDYCKNVSQDITICASLL